VNWRLRFLCCVLAACSGLAAFGENIEPGSFIRKKGTYEFGAERSSVDVITAKDKKPSLRIMFRTREKHSTSEMGANFEEEGILRGDGWFVFIESGERIWIYDGKKSLAIAQCRESSFVIKDFDTEGAAVCPLPVKKALPKDVRDALFAKHLF
jgi:hypothetical protein